MVPFQDIYQKSIFWYLLSLFVFFFLLLYQSRHLFLNRLKIKKNQAIILLAVFILGFVLRSIIFQPVHLLYMDEPMHLEVAKNMLHHFEPLFCSPTHSGAVCKIDAKPLGWPFIISISFFLFGINNFVAIYTSVLFGSLSVVILYFLAWFMFKNENVALFSSLMLALNPIHINWSRTAETVVPALFFVILAILFFMLYLDSANKKILLLSATSLIITVFMRAEYLLLFGVFFLWFFFSGKKVKDLRRGDLFLLFLISTPFIILQDLLLNSVIWDANPAGYFTIDKIPHSFVVFSSLLTICTLVEFFLFLYPLVISRRYAKQKFFFFLLSLIFLLFYLGVNFWQVRMLFIPLLSFIILASLGLEEIIFSIKKLNHRSSVFIALFLIISLNVPGLFALSNRDISPFILETNLPNILEAENNGCLYVALFPMVFSATTNLSVVSPFEYLKSPQDAPCTLYLADGYNIDSPLSPRIETFYAPMQKALHNLTINGSLAQGNLIYIIYNVH